jgi:hypothetical protein
MNPQKLALKSSRSSISTSMNISKVGHMKTDSKVRELLEKMEDIDKNINDQEFMLKTY